MKDLYLIKIGDVFIRYDKNVLENLKILVIDYKKNSKINFNDLFNFINVYLSTNYIINKDNITYKVKNKDFIIAYNNIFGIIKPEQHKEFQDFFLNIDNVWHASGYPRPIYWLYDCSEYYLNERKKKFNSILNNNGDIPINQSYIEL